MASIFLQLPDGTTQALSVSAGSAPNKVVLGGAPSVPLVVDDTNFALPTYEIVPDTDGRVRDFLIAEKEMREDRKTVVVRAVNYDARVYRADQENPAEEDTASGAGGGWTGGGGGGGGGGPPPPPPAPTIWSIDPTADYLGETLTIFGANFVNVVSVHIGSRSVTFTVDSPTSIRATIQTTGGKVSVTTATGSAESAQTFTYLGVYRPEE